MRDRPAADISPATREAEQGRAIRLVEEVQSQRSCLPDGILLGVLTQVVELDLSLAH